MKKEQILTLTLAILALSLLTSCGSKKSADVINSSSVILNSPYTLANCNR